MGHGGISRVMVLCWGGGDPRVGGELATIFFVICLLHVCKWKNAYIKDVNALRIFMNYLREERGCTYMYGNTY